MNEQVSTPTPSGLVDHLIALTDAHSVLTGAAAQPYAIDVYRRLQTPIAVVRPASIEALQAVIKYAEALNLAIFARGGGASYTDGYLPTRPDSLILDTGRLDRIVEINETDAYVTVEAGVTWAQLKAALDPLDLRTPFFGPFSGLAATIGGSVSQNALSHGSAAHGVSAQSVLSLDVVTAQGDLLSTGSAARGAAPFARFYGPDLTGLFTGDCGALGVKVRITLPLLRRKPAFQCASFAFASFPDLASAMREAALERLEDENFAIDAALAQGQIARQTRGAIWHMARSVLSSSSNVIAGVAQLGRMAMAGSRALATAEFMLHFIVEGVDQGEVRAKLARLRLLMKAGSEIPNSVPVVVRGMPFAPLFNTLGPKGERWVPLHGILPHSKAVAFHAALGALYADRAAEMKRLGVWTGGMFATVGSSAFLYEVALYWPGPPTAYHQFAIAPEYLASLPTYADDKPTASFVADLKAEITELYRGFGATHFQLGKTYPYAGVLEPEPLALLEGLKALLDPKGLMNPGALGL